MSTPNSTTPGAYVVEVPAPFRTTTQLVAPRHTHRFNHASVQPGAYRLLFTTNEWGAPIATADLHVIVTAHRGVYLGFLPWITFHRTPRTETYAWDLPEVGDGRPAVVGDDDITAVAIFRRIA